MATVQDIDYSRKCVSSVAKSKLRALARPMVANMDNCKEGNHSCLWTLKSSWMIKGKYHSEGLCWLTTQDECKNYILKCFLYIGLANKNTEHLLSLSLSDKLAKQNNNHYKSPCSLCTICVGYHWVFAYCIVIQWSWQCTVKALLW